MLMSPCAECSSCNGIFPRYIPSPTETNGFSRKYERGMMHTPESCHTGTRHVVSAGRSRASCTGTGIQREPVPSYRDTTENGICRLMGFSAGGVTDGHRRNASNNACRSSLLEDERQQLGRERISAPSLSHSSVHHFDPSILYVTLTCLHLPVVRHS